jgi:phosphoribosylformylglycinamidine cyclo-ligase
VRAIRDLLASEVSVHGLAHITGDGLLNLLRIGGGACGFSIDAPLPVPPICQLVCELGALTLADAYETFNMGCGLVVIVPEPDAESARQALDAHHPGTKAIGRVTDQAGRVSVPPLGLTGDREGLRES